MYVKDEPLTVLALAAAAGFVLGGGANRRTSLAILTIIGRIAVRDVATSLIVRMATGTHNKRKQDQESSGGGTHDNGRRDYANPG
jgi:hypothetical protein